MDRRIVTDCIHRWWVISIMFLVYAYAVVMSVTHDEEMPHFFLYYGILNAGWLFFTDAVLADTFRTTRILPVSTKAMARSVWFLGVPLLFGFFCLIVAVGFGMCLYFLPEHTEMFKSVPRLLCCGLLVCSSFYLTTMVYLNVNWQETRIYLKLVSGLGALAFLVYPMVLSFYWTSQFWIPITAIVLTVGQTYASYALSPQLLSGLFGRRSRSGRIEHQPVETTFQPLPELSMSRFCLERWFSNPFISVTVGSFALMVVLGVVVLCQRYVFRLEGKILPLFFILLIFWIIVVFIYRWGAFLSSMRVFCVLPIARRRLLQSCLVLPFFALLPFFLVIVYVFEAPVYFYLFAAGMALFCNALYMQWGAIAAILAINIVGVLLNTMLVLRYSHPDTVAFIHAWNLEYATIAVVIASSSWWTRYLLYVSSAPYRKKAQFGKSC